MHDNGFLEWIFGKKPSLNPEVSLNANPQIVVKPPSPEIEKARLATNKGKFSEIGNAEPICPYCNYRFDKMPQRKKKCPNCAKFIYSRTRPLDNKKVLIKEDQIEDLEGQGAIQTGNGAISFNLVNSRAVALGKIYKETLIKRGGSDITEIYEDEIGCRVFNPWLADASLADRERIADIIISSIKTGNHPKDVAKELKKIPAMSGLNTKQIAEREIKYLLVAGTMERFESENVQQGIWHSTKQHRIPATTMIPGLKRFP